MRCECAHVKVLALGHVAERGVEGHHARLRLELERVDPGHVAGVAFDGSDQLAAQAMTASGLQDGETAQLADVGSIASGADRLAGCALDGEKVDRDRVVLVGLRRQR